ASSAAASSIGAREAPPTRHRRRHRGRRPRTLLSRLAARQRDLHRPGRAEPERRPQLDTVNDDPELHFTVLVAEDDEVLIAPVLRRLPYAGAVEPRCALAPGAGCAQGLDSPRVPRKPKPRGGLQRPRSLRRASERLTRGRAEPLQSVGEVPPIAQGKVE